MAPGQEECDPLRGLKEFPPRQKPASFNVDAVVEKIMDAAAKGPGS